MLEFHAAEFRRQLAAGVPIAMGSDVGPFPHGTQARELTLYAVRSGHCDLAMVRSLRDQIEELPVVLMKHEQDAVATVLAAIVWAVLDASVRDLDDSLVA